MKPCNKCQIEKPLTEFYKNTQLRDGHANDCKDCVKERSRLWVAANKERHAASCKAYAEANPEKRSANAKAWAEKNRERSQEIKAAWKKRNPDEVRRHAREAARRDPEKQAERKKVYRIANSHVERAYLKKRRAENIHQRMHDSMGNRFRDVLRGKKNGKSWVEFAGYGTAELKAHLEALFLPGMSWENYGEWHIDHKRPVASFDFTVNTEETARACWALSNLQPLWAVDNMKKGKKWDGGAA